MPKRVTFDEVVTSLYEAAGDASLWMPALAAMSGFFDSAIGHFFLRDNARNVNFSAVASEAFANASDDYTNYYIKIDPRMAIVDRSPVGSTFTCHHHFDDAFVAKSEIYQDFLIPIGGRYVMGSKPIETSSISAVTSVLRGARQGPFEDADLKRFARLQPHLAQAFRLFVKFNEIGASRDRASAALDRVPWGVAVIDHVGKILETNAVAEALLKAGDALRTRSGRVETIDPNKTATLNRLIHDASAAAGGADRVPGGMIKVDRLSGNGSLTILVAPLRQAPQMIGIKAARGALLFITDSQQQLQLPSTRLSQLFGLTSAETAVALSIASGKTLEEIADQNGVSKNTVRVQTQSVLSKTGVRRQAELVALLFRIPMVR